MRIGITALLIALAHLGSANAIASDIDTSRAAAVSFINSAAQAAGGTERLYRDAATADAPAQYALALMYWHGIVKTEDKRQAVELLRSSAKAGYGPAQLMLGKAYLGVKGSPRLTREEAASKGIDLVRAAAETGDPQAQYILGKHYLLGDALPEDRDLGMFWITRARDQGHPDAIDERLKLQAQMSQGDLGFDYVQMRAMDGSPVFLIKLAEFYEQGWVVDKNPAKAARLRDTAARLGRTSAGF